MKKGNKVELKQGLGYYDKHLIRATTISETTAWRNSPDSKGINCAGETKLPPYSTAMPVEEGDTLTVIRSRCAPRFGWHSYTKMTLVRNERTGEEGYIKRRFVQIK